MKEISKHRKCGKTIREYEISKEDLLRFKEQGIEFRTACLSETMGPNWKDIYWIVMGDGHKRPVVPRMK